VRQTVPDLRILSDDLWEAVQARREGMQYVPWTKQQRPKHLLSGLAYCGVCGERWISIGRQRWGCGGVRKGSTCSNNRSIGTPFMETRVLDGLQERMLDPELVRLFVREYHQEHARRSAEVAKQTQRLQKQHADASAKVNRLVEAIANGADEFVEIKAILSTARAERDRFAAAIAENEALPVVALHPGIADSYRKQVATLAAALSVDDEARLQTMPIVRSLIDRVVLVPSRQLKGVEIEVFGKLSRS
jgi:hypothetical protein